MDEKRLREIEAEAHFGNYPLGLAEQVLELIAEVRRLRKDLLDQWQEYRWTGKT